MSRYQKPPRRFQNPKTHKTDHRTRTLNPATRLLLVEHAKWQQKQEQRATRRSQPETTRRRWDTSRLRSGSLRPTAAYTGTDGRPTRFCITALADAEKVVELKPNSAKGLACVGAAHLAIAVDSYRKGLALEPKNRAIKNKLVAAKKALRKPSLFHPLPSPQIIGRRIQNWKNLPLQTDEDCWVFAIKNLVSMVSILLHGLHIYIDADEIVTEYSELGKGLFEDFSIVLEHLVSWGFPVVRGEKKGRYFPIKSFRDVSTDNHNPEAIRAHLAKHGAAIVTFPINEYYQRLRSYDPKDVINLLHLDEEARKRKDDNELGFSCDHTAILCGVEGEDTYLIKNAYKDFGIENLVKVKVVFEEIFLLEWNDANSPNLFAYASS